MHPPVHCLPLPNLLRRHSPLSHRKLKQHLCKTVYLHPCRHRQASTRTIPSTNYPLQMAVPRCSAHTPRNRPERPRRVAHPWPLHLHPLQADRSIRIRPRRKNGCSLGSNIMRQTGSLSPPRASNVAQHWTAGVGLACLCGALRNDMDGAVRRVKRQASSGSGVQRRSLWATLKALARVRTPHRSGPS